MKLRSGSEADTKDVGRRIGAGLKPGSVVRLYGELGAGKTTMVKGMASALGIPERDITSASFTIIAEHDSRIPFYHIDLYRVNTEGIDDLGLEEYLGGDGIAVIEWAERIGEPLMAHPIDVRIVYRNEDERDIEIVGLEL